MPSVEKIWEELSFDIISPNEAKDYLVEKSNWKLVNFFINRHLIDGVSKEPLSDRELTQLSCIVNILQLLYNCKVGSPVSDHDYDTLQEILVDMGIPRLSGSKEVNTSNKVSHSYENLRGTLSKIYYITNDQKRTNPSRKYLDEWIKSINLKYKDQTGKSVDLSDEKVILQAKYDGTSICLEIDENGKMTWLTRGDTEKNKASDVSHIMNGFNDLYREYVNCGIKFELMVTEESMASINKLLPSHPYKNSRQIVTATINSNEPDFKVDYLYPVPLRIMDKDSKVERIHPDHISKFPTLICKLSDRDEIKKFANDNRVAIVNGMHFRTDGVVITILDPSIQEILGRDNNINNFEVALKQNEEYAYTKIREVIFEPSQFGIITPVLVVNDVILKGNTINRISLSNKTRFDEIDPHVGDRIKILYDVIPYATMDEMCDRANNGKKINFITHCPSCNGELKLDGVQVQCHNLKCKSRVIGRILNYCSSLRMQNIGYQTLESLYNNDLLNKGIRSLYKLKKRSYEIEGIEGFGKIKTRKIISEIESRRRLKDYELMGSIGIESLSSKTFKSIFSKIKYVDFINMIKLKNLDLLFQQLIQVDGMGDKKAELLIRYLKDNDARDEIMKLLSEISIEETYGGNTMNNSKGVVVFSGFRSDRLTDELERKGYVVKDGFSKDVTHLIVKDVDSTSSKTEKARALGIPILSMDEVSRL